VSRDKQENNTFLLHPYATVVGDTRHPPCYPLTVVWSVGAAASLAAWFQSTKLIEMVEVSFSSSLCLVGFRPRVALHPVVCKRCGHVEVSLLPLDGPHTLPLSSCSPTLLSATPPSLALSLSRPLLHFHRFSQLLAATHPHPRCSLCVCILNVCA
jgi:hypothetical protein